MPSYPHYPKTRSEDRAVPPGHMACTCGWVTPNRQRSSGMPAAWRAHALRQGMSRADVYAAERAYASALFTGIRTDAKRQLAHEAAGHVGALSACSLCTEAP